MTISFDQISQTALVPLVRVEFDDSQAAGAGAGVHQNLLTGQMTSAGSATPEVLVRVYSESQAAALFGPGSFLHLQVRSFLRQHKNAQLWCLPFADPAGLAAEGSITIGLVGAAVAAEGPGTIHLLVNGEYVPVPVEEGDTVSEVAALMETLIDAKVSLPVTAAAALGVVTVTAKNVGLVGNTIRIVHNYREELGSEVTPPGLSVTIVQPTGGTLYPTLTTGLAALADERFEWMAHHFVDSTGLDAFQALHNHVTGRWSPDRLLFGHAFAALDDTINNLTTAVGGATRNDPHHTIVGLTNFPQTAPEVAAAVHGAAALALELDPARPLQTIELQGILAPKSRGDYHTIVERETLLNNGLATVVVHNGRVYCEFITTNWQEDAGGNPSIAYRAIQTPATLAEITRIIRQRIRTKFPRHKLVNDGTRYGVGQAVVTPGDIEVELRGIYDELELRALVEDPEAFAAALVVERTDPGINPNSVDVLFPPDLANQFRNLNVKTQFRV